MGDATPTDLFLCLFVRPSIHQPTHPCTYLPTYLFFGQVETSRAASLSTEPIHCPSHGWYKKNTSSICWMTTNREIQKNFASAKFWTAIPKPTVMEAKSGVLFEKPAIVADPPSFFTETWDGAFYVIAACWGYALWISLLWSETFARSTCIQYYRFTTIFTPYNSHIFGNKRKLISTIKPLYDVNCKRTSSIFSARLGTLFIQDIHFHIYVIWGFQVMNYAIVLTSFVPTVGTPFQQVKATRKTPVKW